MRPPPPPVDYDNMDPLQESEFCRILRKLAHDPSNKRPGSNWHRVVPIAAVAATGGIERGSLWQAIKSGTANPILRKRLSPLLRKLDAGVVRFAWDGRRWELENVDTPLPKT
jgi:hypothetical protein